MIHGTHEDSDNQVRVHTAKSMTHPLEFRLGESLRLVQLSVMLAEGNRYAF